VTLAAEAAALLVVGGSLPLVGVGIGWAMATARSDRRELVERARGVPAAAPVVLVLGQLATSVEPYSAPNALPASRPVPLALPGGVEVIPNARRAYSSREVEL
jgi:hypothetical protein